MKTKQSKTTTTVLQCDALIQLFSYHLGTENIVYRKFLRLFTENARHFRNCEKGLYNGKHFYPKFEYEGRMNTIIFYERHCVIKGVSLG